MGKTSGPRHGCTVFGGRESCTGRCWSQGQEGRLTSDASIAFLTRVLEQTTHPLLLIQEGATYHPPAAMQHFWALPPERLTVCQLPSDSPDDQPLEKLWKNVKQAGTHLPYFPTFEALTDQVEPVLLTFAHTPEEILSLCSLPTAMAKVA